MNASARRSRLCAANLQTITLFPLATAASCALPAKATCVERPEKPRSGPAMRLGLRPTSQRVSVPWATEISLSALWAKAIASTETRGPLTIGLEWPPERASSTRM